MTARRVAMVAGIVTAGMVIVVVTALSALFIVQQGRVLPNTQVVGIDVGGMTADELEVAVRAHAQQRQTQPIVFTFEDAEYLLVPVAVGFAIDIDRSVEAAMGRGRQGLLTGIPERLRSLSRVANVELHMSWNEQAVADWVAEIATSIDRPISHGDVTVDPSTLQVTVELPHGSAAVRQSELRELVAYGLTTPGFETVELPVDTSPALIDADELDAVAQTAARAVERSIELTYDDVTLTLSAPEIAQLIGVERSANDDRQSVALTVTPGRVLHVIPAGTAEWFASDPVDASYALDREPPVTFDDQGTTAFQPVSVDVDVVDGRVGTQFSAQLVAAQLTEMVQAGDISQRIRLLEIPPRFPSDSAHELRPTHLLGTFTTYYQAGQARSHNIQRLADTIDGALLLPREQFSINGISGRRTCDGGYLPAGTIIRGELVDTCGGGTSQFGTTTFNAAFFSAVQLDEWKAHSWYISRYPMGREATINYPDLDVKFTNNTDGAVLVKTHHTPSSVTVSVYGQPIAREVRAILGTPSNPRPPRTEVRRTNSLFEGQERVLQSAGSQGFTIRVVQEIERLDGSVSTRNIDTTYLPQNRIVERGTRPRPNS